jgi:hypothetical protein
MGLNDEYSRDAYQFEQVHEDPDDQEEPDIEVSPEMWESIYSEEIFDGWTIFQEYIYSNYLTVRSHCTFTTFSELLIRPEMYESCARPSHQALECWEHIKRVKIVRDRVYPDQFYTWFQIYVNFF